MTKEQIDIILGVLADKISEQATTIAWNEFTIKDLQAELEKSKAEK